MCVKCRCSVTSFERERERVGEREMAKEGNGGGRELERPCATISNLLGFIVTVSLTANTHCMTDGLTLACLAP